MLFASYCWVMRELASLRSCRCSSRSSIEDSLVAEGGEAILGLARP
jgi:hypothetical protein